MDDDLLRSRLAAALALALGAAGAPGCCETFEERVVEREPGNVGLPWDGHTCQDLCLSRIDCDLTKRVVSCDVTGAAGGRVLTCVLERSDCPDSLVPSAVCGRRHEGGDAPRRAAAGDPLGACFAAMAALEAGSVPAFQRLVRELRAHGAPDDLVRDARRAIADERRHARMMARLARVHGGAPALPAVAAGPVRPLAAVALENAVEGCVRETWGALVALWQAERAADPTVRAAMRAVAGDELRHAALAWRVDAWARARLDVDDARRVGEARAHALHALRREQTDVAPALVARVGVPSRRDANRLLDACARALWAEAA